jgi:hypothetical protein
VLELLSRSQNPNIIHVGFLPNPLEVQTTMISIQDDSPRHRTRYPRWRDPELVRRREVLRKQVNLAIARAYVLADPKAHLKPQVAWPYIKAAVPGYLWPTICSLHYAGAPQAALARLRKGELGIENEMRPWTPEFFLGLRLSGALQEKEAGRFRIDATVHQELVEDISKWPIAGRLGTDDGFGRRRLVGCLVTLLPAVDPQGESVLAGLFTGAPLIKIDGEQWLEFPASDQVKSLLDTWTILHESSKAMKKGKEMLRVSPFYAALFMDLMPNCSKERVLKLRRPAMCPLLALLHWEWLFAPLKTHMRILPYADALPFGCSRRTFYRRGWKRKELHQKAVHMGLLSVDQRLRVRINHWFESHLHTDLIIDGSEPITP